MLAERGQQSAQKNSAHWLTRLKIYLLWSSNITWVAPAAAVAGKSGNQLCRSRVRLLPSRVVCFPQPGEIAAPSSPKFETSGHTDTTTESLVVIRLAASSEFHLHHLPANFGNLNNFFSDIKFQDLKGLIYYFLSGGPFDLRGGPFVG